MEGQVLFGINNIYTVTHRKNIYQCRIKGKILKSDYIEYNPIAAGDRVLFKIESCDDVRGMIHERLQRKAEYVRWNKKRNAPQVIAANFNRLVIVTSVDQPPFRPRFIDRVLVMADSGTEILIVLNKLDKDVPSSILLRMNDYDRIGYDVVFTSAKSGKGIAALKKKIDSGVSVFAGQSGVGKSTLLNTLFHDLTLTTGCVSEKYNRGRHTTNYARLIQTDEYAVIDTPGIREIEVFDIESRDLVFHFPEFIRFNHKCFFPSCLHRDEPGCAVKKAVKDGEILSDRYDSYVRILNDIEKKSEY